MAAGIEGNPDQLEAAASRIRRAAATVDGSADDLRARTRSVLGGWRGAAADAYQGHAGRTADHLEGVARIAGAAPAVLVDYADQLRAAQRAFADAHAAHLAAGRRYDHARADQAAARHDADAARLAGEIAADAARARHHAAAAMTTAKQRAHAANEDAAGAITTLTWQIDPSAAHATPHFTAPGGATIDAFRPGDDWHGTRPTNLRPVLEHFEPSPADVPPALLGTIATSAQESITSWWKPWENWAIMRQAHWNQRASQVLLSKPYYWGRSIMAGIAADMARSMTRAATTTARVAGPAGVVVEAGLAGWERYHQERQEPGNTPEQEVATAVADGAITAGGGMLGAGLAALAATGVGAPAAAAIAIVVVGGWVGSKVAGALDEHFGVADRVGDFVERVRGWFD